MVNTKGMIVLGYTGSGGEEGLLTKAFRLITRWAQKGTTYRDVTHVESLLGGTWKNARIGSSSMRDKGVRIKDNVRLKPDNWIAIHVPQFSASRAEAWHAIHNGKKYDFLGALGTRLWFLKNSPNRFICVDAVGIPQGAVDADKMTTAEFIALCMSLPGAVIVTNEFFSKEEK